MPPFTALLHTKNDALRLGRALEMLLPCAEILIVDHHSIDSTHRIAREYGARIVAADDPSAAQSYLDLASHDWIFCMEPGESITEGLQASLFEWSALPAYSVITHALSMFVRKQSGERWLDLPTPETRLIPRPWRRWRGLLPAYDPSALTLRGELLCFALP